MAEQQIDLTALKTGLTKWGAFWQRQSEVALASMRESLKNAGHFRAVGLESPTDQEQKRP